MSGASGVATALPRRGRRARRWYHGRMFDESLLAPEGIRPLRRAEYEELVDLGFFEDEKIELLRGFLVTMSPQKAPHANAPAVLMERLILALGKRAPERAHSPLALGDWSEPEPDVVVVPRGDYSQAHPTEALLVVEASDSSLRKDRRIKAEIYAEHGIPEYWIVNLVERVLAVHSAPAGGRYTRVSTHGPEERVRPLAFPEVEIAVADLVG